MTGRPVDRQRGAPPESMTPLEPIPDGIRRFVQGRLGSVAELEGLLLVRSAPHRVWDARALADRLYIGEPHARLVLEALHRQELISRHDQAFVYGPASDALRADVEAVAGAYPRLLVSITELIHAKSRGRRSQT